MEFDDLKVKGLKGNLQGAIKIEDKVLQNYIKREIQPTPHERISRICWNSNKWEHPSGPKGKSKNGDSYENANGFGHEEWLLDRRKIMPNGYHYGFLEPLRKGGFENSKTIHLYTYNPQGKKMYVGYIIDAEYVDKEESIEVFNYYTECGWKKSMINEIKALGLLQNEEINIWFNIKFRFENFIDFTDKQIFISKEDPNTNSPRYILLNKREPFIFETASIPSPDSDIIIDPNNEIPEGAKARVIVNRYERNPEARQKCLDIKGYSCVVCGMNFKDTYGEIGKDFIHVHHIVPISQIGRSYNIDPEKDLVPVCPNCHAMLHHGPNGKVLSVNELKALVKRTYNIRNIQSTIH